MTDTDSNDAQNRLLWCCRFLDMRARHYSSGKFNAGTYLGIWGFESRGRILPRLFLSPLESDLRAGRAMSVRNNGKIISIAEAHRMVARARVEGWLPP
jgi:hypothetical protein